ncbi:MAG: PASTA domain-containing protein [Sedimentisphaerales bacterium]
MRKLLVLILVLAMAPVASAEIAVQAGPNDANTLGNPGGQITINLLTAEGKQSVAIDLNDISQSSTVRIGYNAQEPIKSFTLELTPDGRLVIDVSRDSNSSQIASSPEVVSVAGSGDYVTLDVSCTVPVVVGMTKTDAEAALPPGFVIGTETGVCSDTIPIGTIVGQDPAGGSSVACGSPINLTYVCHRCTCATCLGDLNGDCKITITDVTALVLLLNSAGAPYSIPSTSCLYNPCGDLNGDGKIKTNDLSALVMWLNGYGPPYRRTCPCCQ